jgi:hypothetical protein
MTRLFNAYVVVDWSAAAKPTTGPDSVWIGILKRNVRFQLGFTIHNPATRKEAEALLAAQLDEFAKRGERALVGFDFPLGFPRGAAAALKLGPPYWDSLGRLLEAEIKDKADNANNRFQVAARLNRMLSGEAFPFWGCPARDEQTLLRAKRPRDHAEGDLPELRFTDAAAKGASSIWKMYYQGSVGGQALTGIPVVRRLKARQPQAIRLWPFETGWKALSGADLEDAAAVFCEVYPSLWKAQPAAGESKDAAQVRVTAEHFAALDEKGQLGRLFGPAKGAEDKLLAVEQEEGWILGA